MSRTLGFSTIQKQFKKRVMNHKNNQSAIIACVHPGGDERRRDGCVGHVLAKTAVLAKRTALI